MGNCLDDLKSLIKQKKTKKDTSKSDRGKFATAWEDLVKGAGFYGDAEKFLYEGVTYYSAIPFLNYMKGEKNPIVVLDELYNGNFYGKNCANTTSLLFHLLALCLNEEGEDLSAVVSLMEHIPEAMKNKEGRIYGQADRVFKKYFIDVLHDNVKLPSRKSLLENGMSIESMDSFIKAIDSVMDKITLSNFKTDSFNKAALVNKWIQQLYVGMMHNKHENKNIQNYNDKTQEDRRIDTTVSEEGIRSVNKKETNDDRIVNKGTANKQLLYTEKQNRQMKTELEHLRNKNKTLEMEYAKIEVEIGDKNNYINELSHNNNELTERITILEKERKSLQEDLDQCMQMLDLVKKDQKKQQNEKQKRMVSQLKSYYQDYLDAQDLDMNTDLEKNLRDQLGEVFEILSSAGIFVK